MDGSQEDDYHNFSTSPTHRLPTLNGAQALQDAIDTRQPISTGLPALDYTLQELDDYEDDDQEFPVGSGVPRGSVTEIYGPPGCGKTTFAIQLAANALKAGPDSKVTWIDTCASLPYERLSLFTGDTSSASLSQEAPVPDVTANGIDEATDEGDVASSQAHKKFSHIHISSFPHLLALLLHPPPEFPPEKTSLLVLDDLSSISIGGLPQRKNEPITEMIEITSTPTSTPGPASPSHLNPSEIISRSLSARRLAMLSSISASLHQLAASRNMAVVILNSSTTNSSRKSGTKSVLRSILSSQQWNENITTRIAIYRDHWPRINWRSFTREEARKQRRRHTFPLRIAEVERLGGQDVTAEGIKFVILKHRLHAVDPPKPNSVVVAIPPPSSPPFPNHDDDNEDAMQNLGIDDIDEDQSLQMPEDVVAPSTSSRNRRPVAEVADSEDEDEIELSQAKLPPMRKASGGFLPSSQLKQDGDGDDESSAGSQNATSEKADDGHKKDEDMLLH